MDMFRDLFLVTLMCKNNAIQGGNECYQEVCSNCKCICVEGAIFGISIDFNKMYSIKRRQDHDNPKWIIC